MALDPYEKVASAEQDEWCRVAEIIQARVLYLLMLPAPSPEHIACTLQLASLARVFHGRCLSFDVEVEAHRDELLKKGCCGGRGDA